MKQIIGVDIGRGYTKAFTIFNGIEKRCCFKSIIDMGRYLEDFDIGGTYIEYDGNDYFVGELAESEGYSPISNNKDSKVTLTAEILLAAVLEELAESSEVNIMLGVPNKTFNKKILDNIQKFYKQKKIKVLNKLTREFKEVLISDIKIFRESDAALLWELRHNSTTINPVGMVTVGFRTTEMTYFERGMKFTDKKSKSLELGNKTALEYAQKQLQFQGISKELSEIDSLDEYNDLKSKGYRILSEKIQQEIDNLWINLSEMIIYYSGGTVLKLDLQHGIIVEDPQMATAKGLYHVGVNVWKGLKNNEKE